MRAGKLDFGYLSYQDFLQFMCIGDDERDAFRVADAREVANVAAHSELGRRQHEHGAYSTARPSHFADGGLHLRNAHAVSHAPCGIENGRHVLRQRS
jgi:hypothetical protein